MDEPASEALGRTAELDLYERRVLGVLVEKAKTTPDNYPLTTNALRSGCNQKSNRFPQMEFDEDRVESVADSLRQKGALTLVQGDSRVERYRHRAYDWFGVDKTELAVLAELLLRGAQTVGELRGRAARMEPIKGIGELTPVVASLVDKGLVEYLSPPGRGAVVTHRYYSPSERQRVCRDHGVGSGPAESSAPEPPAAAPQATPARPATAATLPSGASSAAPDDAGWRTEMAEVRHEFNEQIAELRRELDDLKNRLGE